MKEKVKTRVLTSMYFFALWSSASVVSLSGSGTCCLSTSKQSLSCALLPKAEKFIKWVHWLACARLARLQTCVAVSCHAWEKNLWSYTVNKSRLGVMHHPQECISAAMCQGDSGYSPVLFQKIVRCTTET